MSSLDRKVRRANVRRQKIEAIVNPVATHLAGWMQQAKDIAQLAGVPEEQALRAMAQLMREGLLDPTQAEINGAHKVAIIAGLRSGFMAVAI